MVITVQNHQNKSKAGIISTAKLVCVILFISFAPDIFAQDFIYTVKGAEMKCKVQEIGEDSVSYNDAGAAAPAPIKYIVKKEIAKIRYANGYEEVFSAKANPAKTPEKTTVGTGGTSDVIFTTDGNQLVGKVTEIEDNIVNYVLVGGTTPQKINSKNIVVIRYSNGYEEYYHKAGKSSSPATAIVAKKDDRPASEKDALLIVLQNWKRKYISPPLEIL